MFSVLMIARLRRPLLLLCLAGVAALVTASCQKVPLLAPSGSTITLTASATTLPVNGSTVLIAQVIESAGTVPHSGTRVTFTTSLGAVQPDAADTDINGQARVIFNAGNNSGTATITATSGGVGGTTTTTSGSTTTSTATNSVKIAIGAAAVGHVGVGASPATVPANGGDSTITANVLDTNGSPLASVAVSFSTTTGSLSSSLVNTDSNGVANVILHTATQAVVTASVGAGAAAGGGTGTGGSTSGTSSATVTVGVAGAPTIIITPPTAGVTAGLPATFTFAITAASTNGSTIKDVTVNWGDGRSQDLGAISGSTPVTHTYGAVGSYSLSVVVTDASGNPVSVSTPVSVVPPALALVITPPSSPNSGLPASFTFAPTVPSGDTVGDVAVDWGDGSAIQHLGAITGSAVVSHVFRPANPPTSYTITGTLTDGFGNSITVATSVTVIAVPHPGVTIQATPGAVGTFSATFTITITNPSGITTQDVTISYFNGDTPAHDLGGAPTGTINVPSHPYVAAGSYQVTVDVLDSSGQHTIATTVVTVS